MKRIAIILAGGRSTRMGGKDKAIAEIDGEWLIERVVARLAPQVDLIAISGREDYGTGFTVIADSEAGPRGPAAGLFAAARWVAENHSGTDRFFTVAVDGPFLPDDFVEKFERAGAPAIAVDDDRVHPTFGFWTVKALDETWEKLRDEESVSLRDIAAFAGAQEVAWPGERFFFNVNEPKDLEKAAAFARNQGS